MMVKAVLGLAALLACAGRGAPLHAGRTAARVAPSAGESLGTAEVPWLPAGFTLDASRPKRKKPRVPIRVTSVQQLKDCISDGYRVQDLDVRGDTLPKELMTDSKRAVHPVLQALNRRKEEQSKPGARRPGDDMKIALAIEGGGMRGCVAAGMATAIWHLGLDDAVDVVYGSSAGTLVGAYFIAKQLPYEGPQVYYDVLTSAGTEFIDAQSILRSCGLGLFDLRLQSLTSLFRDRMGKPVLNLDYLLTNIVQKIKPLDWAQFWSKQENNAQPLRIVASGLLSRKSVVLSAAGKHFQSIAELAECMKASMLLPGVTGEVVRLKGGQASGPSTRMMNDVLWREFPADLRAEVGEMVLGGEPMSDALIFEPLPYRSALRENCTHVVVLRTRADDLSVTVKMGTMEKMIMSRFFGRKLGLPHFVTWMTKQYHKLVYAEDVLILNEANRDFDPNSGGKPKLFCIALPKGIPEVKRLETSREVIFNSVRHGFAAAYDQLVSDPDQVGRGWEVAKQIWPDSILEVLPPVYSADANSTSSTPPSSSDGSTQEERIAAVLAAEPVTVGLHRSKRERLAGALLRLQNTVLGK